MLLVRLSLVVWPHLSLTLLLTNCPPSIGGELALGYDNLENRHFHLRNVAANVPYLTAMLLTPEGDPDTLDIPTLRSYTEGITVPPPGANIVDGMLIFRVKRPSGSPRDTKARYVVRGFRQRQGHSVTTKLHSLDFSTALLQGSLYEEIWLRRPPGFTGSFPEALGFAPSTTYPSLFLRTDPTLPSFYILVYIGDLVFATAVTEALALVKVELQKRHTCTDLGPSALPFSILIATVYSSAYEPLTLSSTFERVCRAECPYPDLVGYLVYLMSCIRPDLVYPLSILACYVAPERHRLGHYRAATRLLRYLCSTSGMALVLGGRNPVALTGHSDAHTVTLLVSWRSICSSSVLCSTCEAEIYAEAMAAQELR
ncbi:unnamed protein product [Closterium sp. NIES-53]